MNDHAVRKNLAFVAATACAELDQTVSVWRQNSEPAGLRLYCRAGCPACCSLAVNCTFPEAQLVAAALPDTRMDHLRQHVAVLRTIAAGSESHTDWLRRHRNESGGCPFLGEKGLCGIYDVRPLSCRSLLSTRPADWCGVDFRELSSLEKQLFISSLDQTIVDFPSHYAHRPKELGQIMEDRLLTMLQSEAGYTLYGNLPALVLLACEIQEIAADRGLSQVAELITRLELDSPYLTVLQAVDPSPSDLRRDRDQSAHPHVSAAP